MTQPSTSAAFGPRLRALRTAKSLSLSEFARRLFYSKGHVSRIETGAQAPSLEFARRCDAALDTGGELAMLVPSRSPGNVLPALDDNDDDGTWMVTMGPDGTTSFVQVGRRDLLLGGAAVLAGLGMGSRPARHRQAVTMPRNLTQYHQVLETLRELGQVAAPQSVLPMVAGHAHTLRMLAKETRGRDALDVAMLSARTAEFAGWMAQEAGDDGAAAWWAGRAVQVAAAAGDRHTAAYSQVRRALVTMYQGDAEATVEFARRAQADPGTHPRILGLAAQREAQGHALAGDHTACLRALDRAAHYLSVAGNSPSQGPVIGTSHVSDPVSVVTGWCLYDLGRPQEAAELLDREVLGIPATAVRMRTRFGVRQALAHSAAGDLDRACDLAQSMVQQASTLGSATILTDLARLATSLRRWNSHTAVRALEPAFGEALYRGAY